MFARNIRQGISTIEVVVIGAVIGIGVIVAVTALTPEVKSDLDKSANFIADPASFGKPKTGGLTSDTGG